MTALWKHMTPAERAEWVRETNRAACERQGIPEHVTDPVHLEPAVRAVLSVALPASLATAGPAAGVEAGGVGSGAPRAVRGSAASGRSNNDTRATARTVTLEDNAG